MGSLRPRELTEFISLLWGRKKLILLMALAMLLATLIVIHRIPNMYESSALVAVNLRNDPGSMPEMKLFAKLQRELTSRKTGATLVRRHSLYPKAKDEEEAVVWLQKALKIETRMRNYSPQVPEAIEIGFRHSEPKKAQAVVTDLIRVLEHGAGERKTEASAESGRLANQIAEVEERLQELAPELVLEMIRLESMYRSRAGAAVSASQASGSAAYGALLTEKSKVEADIQAYSDQYTDKHPKMIQLRNKLAEINRRINRLEAQTGGSMPMTIPPEGRDLLAMRRDLRRMEYNTLVKRYNWLLDKQDSLLKSSAERDSSRPIFHVKDKANLPRLPAAPNRLLLQSLALVMAVAFGLAVAFAVETPRLFRINDSRDIEYFLGAPVLAAIPKSLTSTERAYQRRLRWSRDALIMAITAVLAPILVLLLTYLRVFQIIANRELGVGSGE